jgi:hypothetical protein
MNRRMVGILGLLAVGAGSSAPARAATPAGAAAIAACTTGMAGAETLSPGAWMRRFGEVCGDLYAAPACRDAWRAIGDQPPEARLTSVVEPCRAAYCPTLPAPKPEICSVEGVVPVDRLALWPSLSRLVLSRDLGISPDEVDALITGLPHPALGPSPADPIRVPATPPAPPLGDRLTITTTAGGVHLVLGGAAADFGPGDEAGIAAWVTARLAQGDGALTIVASRDTDFRLVRAALTAANERGRTKIQFQSAP